MNSFRTIVPIKKAPFNIGHNHKILFIGSCFTENIGNKLAALKFKTDINPFGIVYNPVSVYQSFDFLIEKKLFTSSDLLFYQGKWLSLFHHGKFSNEQQDDCLQEINNRIIEASEFIKSSDFLFITFGTAYIYKHLNKGIVVSNCHKIPDKEFQRCLLSVDEIIEKFQQLITKIRQHNSEVKIIFTVSPIRHWKDSAEGNQLSKSTLIIAIHRIMQEFVHTFYFPSYEIMMDDLRDYRFYDEDMLHPSKIAVQYIWERFSETYFNAEIIQINKEIQQIIQASEHRLVNPTRENSDRFAKQMLLSIEPLERKYPYLNLEKERQYFEQILKR